MFPLHRYTALIGILIAVILVEAGILTSTKLRSLPSLPENESASFKLYADQILTKCAGESHRQSCYEKEIPKLMDTISMEDAFRVTRIVQDKDSSYRYCHVTGHNLSAREVDKDPSKWKEIVSRCPSGMCSNGCIHGGFQQRFRAEYFTDAQIQEIKPDLDTLCEKRANWHPTGLEQASCYHALGHLTMYLTRADINKSISLCEELAKKSDGRDLTQLCFDGVFMQIFQPLEPEDFALVKGKEVAKEELSSFCKKFDGNKKASCWTEGWPLFFEELTKPEGLVRHCSATDSKGEEERCYNALVYVFTAQFNFNTKKIYEYCSGLPEGKSSRCFANAASRLIETDYRNIHTSVALCSKAAPFDKDSECFMELLTYSTYNYHPGSAEFFAVCNSLPETWKTKCINKEGATGFPHNTDSRL